MGGLKIDLKQIEHLCVIVYDINVRNFNRFDKCFLKIFHQKMNFGRIQDALSFILLGRDGLKPSLPSK
jgi:hypothetical protein